MFFDENVYVLSNPHVNTGLSGANFLWAFHSLEYANWHPLTWLSHMLDVQLYGLMAWGHHLTNVLLHALNTVLVFLVFRKMTGANWRSLIVAGLFGLHPLRVESVAWISERKDVLSGMFWLLCMWAYTSFVRAQKGRSGWFYGLTLLFFALGLMSKAMLVTLPLVFLLLDYWPLNRWRQNDKWRLILEKIPFFVLAAGASTIVYIAQQRGGAMEEMINLPFSDRIGNAMISYVRYLGKFFWPENLCIYYPHPGHWPAAEVLLAGVLVAGVSLLAWMKRGRWPWLFVGWFWFAGALIPVINLVQLYSQSMADRYTYVPMIGVTVMLVWGLCEWKMTWARHAFAATMAAGLILCACAAVTRHEIGFWKDNIMVWTRALAVTKNNYVAHNNLGILLRPDDRNAAFLQFQEAVRENPGFADAQRNLADQLFARRLFGEAIIHYQKSLDIDPHSAWAEFGCGLACYRNGEVDRAIPHFQKAVQYDPGNPACQYDLGACLLIKGRWKEAAGNFQATLKINADYPLARTNLDMALELEKQALNQSNQPSQLDSGSPHRVSPP